MQNKELEIYFDEFKHKYTDNFKNPYTSVTTKLSEFEKKFDKELEASKCAEKGSQGKGRYVGMTKQQILRQWSVGLKYSQNRGNKEHSRLEESIKLCNGYTRVNGNYINGRIYTVKDILLNPNHGELDINKFLKTNIAIRFPDFASLIVEYSRNGYRLYPEICTYSYEHLISGLIDLLLINFNSGNFSIVDYKTNKKRLIFKSGYYKKNYNGTYTNEFIEKAEYFKAPINTLEYSKGNLYNLQLSFYANLTERFGLVHQDNLLFHIRPEIDEYGDIIDNNNIETEWYTMTNLKKDINKILNVHLNKILMTRNTQTKLII